MVQSSGRFSRIFSVSEETRKVDGKPRTERVMEVQQPNHVPYRRLLVVGEALLRVSSSAAGHQKRSTNLASDAPGTVRKATR